MPKPIRKLRVVRGAYHAEACIIADPKLGEEFIVVARDSGVLQRVLSRLVIELNLDSRKNRKVTITQES